MIMGKIAIDCLKEFEKQRKSEKIRCSGHQTSDLTRKYLKHGNRTDHNQISSYNLL